jgi:hypothetical protein
MRPVRKRGGAFWAPYRGGMTLFPCDSEPLRFLAPFVSLAGVPRWALAGSEESAVVVIFITTPPMEGDHVAFGAVSAFLQIS